MIDEKKIDLRTPGSITSKVEIKKYFKENQEHFFYICPAPVDLINMLDYVNNFNFINCTDTWGHPNIIVPTGLEQTHTCTSYGSCVNALLQNEEIIYKIKSKSINPKLIFLTYDQETEILAHRNGFEIWNPPASLYQMLDSKTRVMPIIQELNLPLLPYVVTNIESYEHLKQVTDHLGENLVIQAPTGDSGRTTFFINNRATFKQFESEITNGSVMRITKYINCITLGIEACATRNGTIVGPLLSALVGLPELTRYKGGWCGDELFKEVVNPKSRIEIYENVKKLGNYLYNKCGFQGCFEVDFLLDMDTKEVFFGELNPRISGCTLFSNQAHGPQDLPLVLFHLLEYANVDFKIDVNELNAYWKDPDHVECYSQLIIEDLNDKARNLKSGIWRREGEQLIHSHFNYNMKHLKTSDEVLIFILKGLRMAHIVFKGRIRDENYQLNISTNQLIKAFKKMNSMS